MKEDLVGWKALESHTIKCSGCGKPLAAIDIVETNEDRINRKLAPQTAQYKITECYNCGGSSFWSNFFKGSLVVGSTRDDYLLEPAEDIDVDGQVIKVVLKCQKKRKK